MEKRPQHDPELSKKNENMPLKKALNKRDWPGSAWGPGELENSVSVIKIDQGLAWERLGPREAVIKIDQGLAWERLGSPGKHKEDGQPPRSGSLKKALESLIQMLRKPRKLNPAQGSPCQVQGMH